MDNMEQAVLGQVAVIPRGTVIKGNIEMNGRLEMYGTVYGDITSSDKVHLCGEVNGNLKVSELEATDSFVEGQIACVRGARIGENTVVLGDVTAENLDIDGAIKGNLDVKGNITVRDKAIIDSDIKAKTIQVSNGAAINGRCSLCYADIDMQSLFGEIHKVNEVNERVTIQNKEKNRRNVS